MLTRILIVQIVFVAAFGAAYALSPGETTRELVTELTGIEHLPPVVIPRTEPLAISPLFDRADMPAVVTDEELAYVLRRVRPLFSRERMRPNLVEHALRTWGKDATFTDPQAISGADMVAFLTDHARFMQSWGEGAEALLQEREEGIAVRWGKYRESSVHHDHWLASLSEAGVTLSTPVYGPGRRDDSIETVLREALRDFRLDEREAEWTALAFGLWLAPEHEWTGSGGRHYSFDLIARRLMRGECETGVCVGTHRVYSLVVLIRLDDEFPEVLSDAARGEVDAHLIKVRDMVIASQFPDGHWPGNWPEGAAAVEKPREDKLSTHIIAAGHHLEWQAIAPAHLRLSDEQNRKAAEWQLATMGKMSDADILTNYTFCTHVGNAFALWRKTRPTPFWQQWTKNHPGFEMESLPGEKDGEAAPATNANDH